MLKLIGYKLLTSIPQINGVPNSVRFLFANLQSKIQKYAESREQNAEFITDLQAFKQEFVENLTNDQYGFRTFENDFKCFLHIMRGEPTDIKILGDAVKTLAHKQRLHNGHKFHFGPLVLNACHFLNMPTVAMKMIEDKSLNQVFYHVTGYIILLDMLYEAKLYSDVLRIYKDLSMSGRILNNAAIQVIVLGACYRLNTPEALKVAYSVWNNKVEKENRVKCRRSRIFLAGLTLKQQQHQKSLDILEIETTYITACHIKLLALAQIGQFEKMLELFRTLLTRYEKKKKNGEKYHPTISKQVINDIQLSLKQNGSEKENEEFHKIRSQIENFKLDTEETLDDMICAPVGSDPNSNEQSNYKLE